MCFVGYLLEGLRAKMAQNLKMVALFSLFRRQPIEGTFSETSFIANSNMNTTPIIFESINFL